MIKISQRLTSVVRSSRPDVFCKKGVLRNFAKFTGKHLYQRNLLNKIAGVRHNTYRTPPEAASVILITCFSARENIDKPDQVFFSFFLSQMFYK